MDDVCLSISFSNILVQISAVMKTVFKYGLLNSKVKFGFLFKI